MAPSGSAKELDWKQYGPPCAIDLVEVGQVAPSILRRPVIKSAEEPLLRTQYQMPWNYRDTLT